MTFNKPIRHLRFRDRSDLNIGVNAEGFWVTTPRFWGGGRGVVGDRRGVVNGSRKTLKPILHRK